jgi:hypothetical protein
MNKVVALLILCVLLALVKAAIIALGLALLLAGLVALIKHPRDTLLCLLTVMLIGLANARPMAFIVALAVVSVAVVLTGWKRRPARPLLLNDGRGRAQVR